MLNNMRSDCTNAGFDIVAVSADSREKALADLTEFGWSLDLCYGLTKDQMATLSVYVTEPLSPEEADGRFAEPGTFVLRGLDSQVIVSLSDCQVVRAELAELLAGMIFNKNNDRPQRRTI